MTEEPVNYGSEEPLTNTERLRAYPKSGYLL